MHFWWRLIWGRCERTKLEQCYSFWKVSSFSFDFVITLNFHKLIEYVKSILQNDNSFWISSFVFFLINLRFETINLILLYSMIECIMSLFNIFEDTFYSKLPFHLCQTNAIQHNNFKFRNIEFVFFVSIICRQQFTHPKFIIFKIFVDNILQPTIFTSPKRPFSRSCWISHINRYW